MTESDAIKKIKDSNEAEFRRVLKKMSLTKPVRIKLTTKVSEANSAATPSRALTESDVAAPKSPKAKLVEPPQTSSVQTPQPSGSQASELKPQAVSSSGGAVSSTSLGRRIFNKLRAWWRRRSKAKNRITQDQLSVELFKERVAEQRQRRRFRIIMFWCFFILLLVQYAGLAALIWFAVRDSFIDKVQPLLSIIIPATLGETYAIIRVMVNFVFSPGDFGENKNIPKNSNIK